MVKKINVALELQALRLNAENHNESDIEHFSDIKERLDRIEAKLDKWTLKVAGFSAVGGLIASVVVVLITKLY